MSLYQGGLGLRRFLVLGPVPEDDALAEGLAENRFRPFQDGLEEERAGWCDWRNPLIIPPDAAWVRQDRFAVFGLRIDTRRVPSALLKAHVDLRIRQLMAEKDLAFIGKEARISIQDEVKAELLHKVVPAMRVSDLAWDLKGGVLWTTATSGRAVSAVIDLFMKSFGAELQPLHPLLLAGRVAPELPVETLMALDPMDLELDEVE
jgi:DNA recombination-dependent growth factor C